jgi:3-mercaptopyruvate sulfurtransferase SseA
MPRSKERQVFVSVDWLTEYLRDDDLRIIDACLAPRTDLHPWGQACYAEGHISGAVTDDLDTMMARSPVQPA